MPKCNDCLAHGDAVSPADLRSILDTHGLRVPDDVGDAKEARRLRFIYRDWVRSQGINPNRRYVLPLRTALDGLMREYGSESERRSVAAQISWSVLTDAINDDSAGIRIVRLRRTRRAV